MSDTITIVSGATQAVTVVSGGVTHSVSVQAVPAVQVTASQSPQSLALLLDVATATPGEGDVLQYGNGKWRNNAVLDGGNW